MPLSEGRGFTRWSNEAFTFSLSILIVWDDANQVLTRDSNQWLRSLRSLRWRGLPVRLGIGRSLDTAVDRVVDVRNQGIKESVAAMGGWMPRRLNLEGTAAGSSAAHQEPRGRGTGGLSSLDGAQVRTVQVSSSISAVHYTLVQRGSVHFSMGLRESHRVAHQAPRLESPPKSPRLEYCGLINWYVIFASLPIQLNLCLGR